MSEKSPRWSDPAGAFFESDNYSRSQSWCRMPTVPFSCAAMVPSPAPSAVTDLSQSLSPKAGENQKTVGNVTETCNSSNGYKITLVSTNSGKLKSGNNESTDQVNYDNQGGALTSQMVVDRANAQFSKKSDLKVTIPASDQYIAGDYADTITVTIAAK